MTRVALATILLLLLPLALAGGAREETRYYNTGAWPVGFVQLHTSSFGCQGVNVGGVCFAVQPGETSVTFEVHDASTRPIPVQASFRDAERGGNVIGTTWVLCNGGTLAIPDTAVILVVVTSEFSSRCPVPAAVATWGNVHAAFT